MWHSHSPSAALSAALLPWLLGAASLSGLPSADARGAVQLPFQLPSAPHPTATPSRVVAHQNGDAASARDFFELSTHDYAGASLLRIVSRDARLVHALEAHITGAAAAASSSSSVAATGALAAPGWEVWKGGILRHADASSATERAPDGSPLSSSSSRRRRRRRRPQWWQLRHAPEAEAEVQAFLDVQAPAGSTCADVESMVAISSRVGAEGEPGRAREATWLVRLGAWLGKGGSSESRVMTHSCRVLIDDIGAAAAAQRLDHGRARSDDAGRAREGVEAERKKGGKRRKHRHDGGGAANRTRGMIDAEWHDDYHSLDEINAHLDELQAAYPHLVQLVTIGTTHEGRPLRVVRISKATGSSQIGAEVEADAEADADAEAGAHRQAASAQRNSKLGVIITSGMHAREWIGPSVSMYFISNLLSQLADAVPAPQPPSNVSSTQPDPSALRRRKKRGGKGKKRKGGGGEGRRTKERRRRARWLLENLELNVLPVSNPDGYAYTWDKNRMWRKNRQPNDGWLGGRCPGLDLNRGFSSHWERVSPLPCSESYSGTEPLQALENRAMADYIQSSYQPPPPPPPTQPAEAASELSDASDPPPSAPPQPSPARPPSRVVSYVDLHSYGQQLLYPYAFSCAEAPRDEEDLVEAGIGAARALRAVHGRGYEVGRTCETLYQASGSSIDFAYDGGAKWSFALELRDEGSFGFLLPRDEIRPSGEETTEAILYLLEFVARKEGRKH